MLGVIGIDKVFHLAVCIILSTVCTAAMPTIDGVGITMSVGVGKEIYDMNQPGNYFSWGDIAADSLGTFIGAQIGSSVRDKMMEQANINFAISDN